MTYEINFNISYSLLSVFKTSPLQFYFQYIDELPYDTKVVSCYGDGGTAVHTVAEEYINNKTLPTETLVKEWKKHNIDSKKGFNGQPLNMYKYDKMGFQAKVIIDKYKKDGYALQTELLIEHEFEGTGIKVKGYIDCVATKGDRVVLIDWKTNSEVKSEHKDQQLFYAFLYHLKFGKIPDEFVWHYLKLNKTLQQRFITPREIEEQRTAIREFIANIKSWGKDIKHYNAGDYKQPFNPFLKACEDVVLERMNRNQQNFVITITGNYCKLSGDVNDLIHKGLVRELTYLEKNRFYMIKNLRPRFITQYINKNGCDMVKANEYAERRCYDIGRHTLYNKSLGLFPIGMIPRVKKILQDYCDYKDASLNIKIIDKRDKDIMNKTLPIPDIQSDKILRPYQEDAIKTFTENPVCVLQLPTGCVDCETEFFSQDGWKKISKYVTGDSVMQYNLDGTSELVIPSEYIKKQCNEMYFFESKYGLNQCLSAEHKILYRSRWGLLNTILMKDFAERHNKRTTGMEYKFLTTFKPIITTKYPLSDDCLRLMVAVIADGSFIKTKTDRRCLIHIKKERKIIRLRKLLKKCNLKYIENKRKNGFVDIRFESPEKKKYFDKSFYLCSNQQLKIISDECLYWDGNCKNKFSTTIKESADFIQYCFSSCGFRSSIYITDRVGERRTGSKSKYVRKSIEYDVGKTKRTETSLECSNGVNKIKTITPIDGYKYCFSVPSGFLVLRRKNKIFITGNSGKTFIASHIISQMKKQTLVLIDRVELLDQLHTVLSENFDCKIGKIGDSECDIQNITVATVQTLSRNDIKDDIKDWLNDVSFVVVDEFHKAASESFYKVFSKIPNAKYRLGLTGTAKRTDGKELALFGLIGDIEVSVTIDDLIRQGYLMKPDITFFRVPKTEEDGEDYMKDYTNSIINSDWRNNKICDLAKNKDKKILILTKFVQKHGKVLSKSIPQAMHINSGTPRKKRKDMMVAFRKEINPVLITTTQIAGTGLDIEDLDIIINASGNDSEITSIQMLGRVLRTSKWKLTAYYYDFLDSGRYTKNNSRNRMNQFRNEGHVVKIA